MLRAKAKRSVGFRGNIRHDTPMIAQNKKVPEKPVMGQRDIVIVIQCRSPGYQTPSCLELATAVDKNQVKQLVSDWKLSPSVDLQEPPSPLQLSEELWAMDEGPQVGKLGASGGGPLTRALSQKSV
ncbi:hypothetical protein N7478_008822 [Penicillium angulare]|uniref:uncharacterized protein n=1 Tax=Penicillium angulare TaxID=116970 RepID=UPI002540A9C6|nr:uncharacterized protein N7478_008822 [Penicillium angulare]KAJ5273697.1 hypothetical protein N7478_008822 [Penicillium angulare]